MRIKRRDKLIMLIISIILVFFTELACFADIPLALGAALPIEISLASTTKCLDQTFTYSDVTLSYQGKVWQVIKLTPEMIRGEVSQVVLEKAFIVKKGISEIQFSYQFQFAMSESVKKQLRVRREAPYVGAISTVPVYNENEQVLSSVKFELQCHPRESYPYDWIWPFPYLKATPEYKA